MVILNSMIYRFLARFRKFGRYNYSVRREMAHYLFGESREAYKERVLLEFNDWRFKVNTEVSRLDFEAEQQKVNRR